MSINPVNPNGHLNIFQEVEEANIKKDAQIAELSKELKLIKKELEIGNGGIANDHSFSLEKLQREHDKEKEEFEKREQDYVKRLESANNENSETEKELQDLRTKILKMEMNEKNMMEEVCKFFFSIIIPSINFVIV